MAQVPRPQPSKPNYRYLKGTTGGTTTKRDLIRHKGDSPAGEHVPHGQLQGKETKGLGQNCVGAAAGVDEYIRWEGCGPQSDDEKLREAQLRKALSFIPEGWVRVDCRGVDLSTTRCTCEEPEADKDPGEPRKEREVIVWIWQVYEPIDEKRTKYRWAHWYHAIGRPACELPRAWNTKLGRGETVEHITDPYAHWLFYYGRWIPSKTPRVEKLCFCVENTVLK